MILLANCAWKGPRLPQRPVPHRTVPNQPTVKFVAFPFFYFRRNRVGLIDHTLRVQQLYESGAPQFA